MTGNSDMDGGRDTLYRPGLRTVQGILFFIFIVCLGLFIWYNRERFCYYVEKCFLPDVRSAL